MLLQHIRDGFYGGAGGGGKSEWLLMEALQYVDVPGYSALIIRRTYQDLILPEALMSRAHDWLDTSDAVWNDEEHTWTFPCPGGGRAKLVFGYLEHEDDKRRYKSAAFQFIGVDELTDFSETQFRFLFSRTRKLSGFPVPIRIRSASNPGGPGHDWVRSRYIDVSPMPANRFTIRATMEDNPHLDREDYLASLEETDPETRRQIMFGDWNYRPEGNKFKRGWLTGKFLQYRPELVKVVRYWDLASREAGKGRNKNPDWTVGVLMGLGKQRQVVVLDVARLRAAPGEIEDFVAATADLDAAIFGRGKVLIGMEQEPGSSGVNTIENYVRVLHGHLFRGITSTGSKEVRFNLFAAQVEHGNVWLIQGPWNEAWLEEHEVFPDKRYKDDQVDATSGAYSMMVSKIAGRPAVKVI